jgi:hypothetical protein
MAIFNEKTGKYVPNPFNDPEKRDELWERLRNGKRITKEEFFKHIQELRDKKAARESGEQTQA